MLLEGFLTTEKPSMQQAMDALEAATRWAKGTYSLRYNSKEARYYIRLNVGPAMNRKTFVDIDPIEAARKAIEQYVKSIKAIL